MKQESLKFKKGGFMADGSLLMANTVKFMGGSKSIQFNDL